MNALKAQFKHKTLSDHFEADPHLEVRGRPIARIHVLHGETADDDLTVVEYESSPALSFYNTRGRLIDVDHYLPDHYPEADQESMTQVLENLRGASATQMSRPDQFRTLLDQVFDAGDRSIAKGLRENFGLETTLADELRFKAKFNFRGSSEVTGSHEVTIINSHRSVVPGKWSTEVKLPAAAIQVRADENLATLFAQDDEGRITVYDITSPEAEEIADLGKYAPGFQLDATGSVIGRRPRKKDLVKITTNVPDLYKARSTTSYGRRSGAYASWWKPPAPGRSSRKRAVSKPPWPGWKTRMPTATS